MSIIKSDEPTMLPAALIDYIDLSPEGTKLKILKTRRLIRMYEQEFGVDDTFLSDCAAVYCLGNRYISDEVLHKKGKLDILEKEIIGLAPFFTYKMIKGYAVSEDIKSMVLYYHTDSPTVFLSDKDEPLPEITKRTKEQRFILNTADAYTALTSERTWRRAYTPSDALSIMDNLWGIDNDMLDLIKDLYV